MDKKRPSFNIFNIQYALSQGLYWMGFCCCVGFTVVYLQGRGYTNSLIGVLIALGNLVGVLLAPVLATYVDKVGRRGLFCSLAGLMIAQLVFQIVFMLIPGQNIIILAAYMLYIAFVNAGGGLVTQLSTELSDACGSVDFGVGRGTGSLFFAVTSAVVGVLLENVGTELLPYISGANLICQILLLNLIAHELKQFPAPSYSGEVCAAESSTLGEFLRNNKRFCFMMLGAMLMYISHNLVTSFLINPVRAVGGTTSDMGTLNGFMALVEFPMMMLYDRLTRRSRIDPPLGMCIGSAFFVLKGLAFALAGSVTAMYFASLLQPFSYAVITIASVRYVVHYISPRDAAKGQSVTYGVTTLASVFSGLFGGVMYDHFPARTVLLAGAATAALGAVAVFVFSKPDSRNGEG